MNLARALGAGMMRGAELLAPSERAEWVRGMHAEFRMLEGDGAALSWAGGSLWTALGLRMQAEAIYALVLVTAKMSWPYLPFEWARDRLAGDPYLNEYILVGASLALLAFSLGVYKPRRIPLTAVLVFLVGLAGALLGWMFTVRIGFREPPHVWMVIGKMMFDAGWPAIPGALAAWVFVRLTDRRRLSAG